jgi:hypothetical protein
VQTSTNALRKELILLSIKDLLEAKRLISERIEVLSKMMDTPLPVTAPEVGEETWTESLRG